MSLCMWLFTRIGFFSVVVDRRDPDLLLVRARDRSQLEALCTAMSPRIPHKEIVNTPGADYPVRIIVPRSRVADFLSEHVNTLDYSNFKGAVDKDARPARYGSSRRYAAMLHEVWSVVREAIDMRLNDGR